MAKKEEFAGVNQKDVTDIRSLARLRLVFDTNVKQAFGYGQWAQRMTPAALEAYPAARLIRDRGVSVPRPRHQSSLGEVRLKTDPRWAEWHNAHEIGGFGVPWGPYGFNSGVTQEDVSRKEAKVLGLDVDSVSPVPAKITDGLQASVKKMDPALKAKLLKELNNRPPVVSPKDAARKAAAETRKIMLNRGLEKAVKKGDQAMEAKYRQAISDLSLDAVAHEAGGKIVLEPSPDGGMVKMQPIERAPNEDENKKMDGISRHTEWTSEDQSADTRATAIAVRAASRKVYSGWTEPKSDTDPGSIDERAIEAQISAAVDGRKPLYFEPWGDQEVADRFASSYREAINQPVEIHSRDGMVFVYRSEAVRKIMDSDPSFYRREGESDLDSIVRVSKDYENGELLGYGARNMMARPAYEVRLFKGDGLLLYFFVSSPDESLAIRLAMERALDFTRAFGWRDVKFVLAYRQ